MFQSILIANRGEIACRIIGTARRMGLRTIAVYSRADADACHVRMADEAHLIGPAPAALSYLDSARVLEAAIASGAQCIHPGYGFLSENAEFAQSCAGAGVAFIGPPPSAIRAMGLKDEAKALMRAARVPVTPGYDGADQSDEALAREARAIGYPVLIKAVAGGGGKGMRRVALAQDFAEALASARREAQAAFGNQRVLIEKWISAPRHIEMQIMADAHGSIVHLNERDCSLQRRHQKVIEEAPAPFMGEAMRAAMGQAAVEAARAVGYTGAGTVEFIVSGDNFYFMEMNTRLQVEHPVTEAITGLDLVELQLRVAAGEPLPFAQSDVAISGHAIEARIYAEDPRNGFLPSSGTIALLRLPDGDGIRVDTGVEEGAEISPHYDPMIGKLIAHGPTREQARLRLAGALAQTLIAGPKSNVDFLHAIAVSDLFASGRYDTSALDGEHGLYPAVQKEPDRELVRLAALALIGAPDGAEAQSPGADDAWRSPWDADSAFQMHGERRQSFAFLLDQRLQTVELIWPGDGAGLSVDNGAGRSGSLALDDAFARGLVINTQNGLFIRNGLMFHAIAPVDYNSPASTGGSGGSIIAAPMHGRLAAVFVQPGERVTRGMRLAIVEAMKMEHVLTSPREGIVESVAQGQGGQVAQGAVIVTLKRQHKPEEKP